MCDQKSNSGLVTGLLIGGVVGAGAAILFGTKKGKEIQNKIKRQYPEVFTKIEDTLDEVRENVDDKVDEVKKDIIREVRPLKKRFVKNGRKL